MKHKKKKIFIAVALTLIIATAAFLFFAQVMLYFDSKVKYNGGQKDRMC